MPPVATQHEKDAPALVYHPAANLFPMMEEEALDGLARDIKAHGQRFPIVLHKGQILDGRNRYEACAIAGVQPKTVQWDGTGGSPTRYVVSVNLHRRQLTPSQRAMVAAELEPHFKAEAEERAAEGRKAGATKGGQAAGKGRPKDQQPCGPGGPQGNPQEQPEPHRAIDDAAAAAGASPRSARRAKAVMEADPALASEVRAGNKTVSEAEREVRESKPSAAPSRPEDFVLVPDATVIRKAVGALSATVSSVQREYLAFLDNPSISDGHKQSVRTAFVAAVSQMQSAVDWIRRTS